MELSFAEAASIFPGFRFSPTDEELIQHYLKKKIQGCDVGLEVIPEVDICTHEPWYLPAQAAIPSEREWFFFAPRGRSYTNNLRCRRSTEMGHWKATGREYDVKAGRDVIGRSRNLVFHLGRAPKGQRTEWVLYEYCTTNHSEDGMVVCRLTRNKTFLMRQSAGTIEQPDDTVSDLSYQKMLGSELNRPESSGSKKDGIAVGRLKRKKKSRGRRTSQGKRRVSQDDDERDHNNNNTTILFSGGGEQSGMLGNESYIIEEENEDDWYADVLKDDDEEDNNNNTTTLLSGGEGGEGEQSGLLEKNICSNKDSQSSEQPDDTVSDLFVHQKMLGSELKHPESSGSKKSYIEEEEGGKEDDCYADIMKEDIVKLDDDEDRRPVIKPRSRMKNTTDEPAGAMPIHGTAHRRIRLQKYKLRDSSRPELDDHSHEQRSFVAKLKCPSIFVVVLLLPLVLLLVLRDVATKQI